MAQNDVKVSALNSVSTLSTNDLSLETVVDELSATGYTSKKITEGDKAAQYLSSFTFSTLDTISKTIIGAINELYAGGGGGGGGSVVTITPALLSGTKVADFSIDGVTGSLYAPTAIDTLSGLTDISITTPTDGQALIYDATTQKWKNATISSGSSSLSGLTDVSLSSPTNGQVLKYNSSTSKWENAAESGGGGGSAECFVVEFEANENTGYYEELSAVQQGKVYSQISFRSNASNLETALADAYYAACVMYPEQFADVDPIAKAGEIFEMLLGVNPYADLKEAGYEFRPLEIGK